MAIPPAVNMVTHPSTKERIARLQSIARGERSPA
jgi:Zn-dependent protease with chaperone function